MGEQSFRFHIVNTLGERIASAEHLEEATQILRLLPSGDRVIEPATMVVHAYKPRAMSRLIPAGDA